MFSERVALLAAGACALAATVSGQNLLGNGSFETPGSGFLIAEDWGNFNNAFREETGSLLFPPIAGFAAQDGDWAIKTFGQFAGGGAQTEAGMFQSVNVTPDAEYTASVWTFNASGDPISELIPGDGETTFNSGHLPLLIIDFRDAGGTIVGSAQVDAYDFANFQEDSWNRVQVTATAPSDAVSAQITLLHLQFGVAPGSLVWDSAEFVQVGGSDACADADYNNDGEVDALDVIDLLNNIDTCQQSQP